jgi:hypothetical protein
MLFDQNERPSSQEEIQKPVGNIKSDTITENDKRFSCNMESVFLDEMLAGSNDPKIFTEDPDPDHPSLIRPEIGDSGDDEDEEVVLT